MGIKGNKLVWCVSLLKNKRIESKYKWSVAQELHKPVIKKFKRGKIYLRFKDNTWAADLAEVVSLSRKNYNV